MLFQARLSFLLGGALALGALGLACGTERKVVYIGFPPADAGPAAAGCTSTAECTPITQTCDLVTSTCVAISDGKELGTGDGTPTSVALTEIYTAPDKSVELVDLAFNGDDPTQLWAIGYADSSVHLGRGVTETEKGTWTQLIDPAAAHFMYKPPAIVWGAGGYWGICGDNDNAQNDPRREPNYFMGPALFTSDLKIFAKPTAGGLGSHYDMLHSTSMCRGIAHEADNWFWTFNADRGSIERYNFNKPHEPGGDDHSDGEIYRYAAGQVKGVDKVSSHIFYDASDKFLYIADTGNARIVKLDTTKGTPGEELPRNEILKKSAVMKGTAVEEVVPPGLLKQPSGLEVRGGAIYVTDAANGWFYVFDKAGTLLRSLDTGLGAKSLSGFTFGPDQKIWFTDRKAGKVIRIDPVAPVP